jgi:hypothetical protein
MTAQYGFKLRSAWLLACVGLVACDENFTRIGEATALGPTATTLRPGGKLKTSGYFSELCIQLPSQALVDIERRVVVLADGRPARLSTGVTS